MNNIKKLGVNRKGLQGTVTLSFWETKALKRVQSIYKSSSSQLQRAIGQSHCKVISVAALQDINNTIRLASDSQTYCEITSIYGMQAYFTCR